MTLMEMDASPDFISLDLRACWQDTALGLVYFNKESIRAIGEKLQLENAFDQRRNNVDELSEIGGFLLGYFYPDGDKDYHVSINTFIPITPEKNDRYTVKFGDRAWSELDDAYKKHPGQRLVGWFHTHPGHGLFLSNADVKVHKDSFKERYQFAMEIDPTTPGSEIAFFSWKKNGKLNNQDDRLLTDWWSFQELEFQSKNT